MNKTFAEKSIAMAFLGTAVLMCAVLIVLNSCTKESDAPKKDSSPKIPSAKENHKKVVSNKRAIYITLDDGPNRGTENLIKIIHKRKIPITAFVVAKHVYGSQKQKNDFKILEKDTLVELANHSFSHANNQYSQFYKNPEKVVADFDEAKDSLRFKNNFARTPGRNIWRTQNINFTDIKSSKDAADALRNSGYNVIGWDLEWKHDGTMKLKDNHKQMLKKVDSIFFNDLEKTSRNLVLLTHDQYLTDENSVKELDLFIEKLQKSNRVEFKKMSDYPNINVLMN